MPQRGAGKAAKAQAATRQSRSCSAEDCRQDPRARPVPSPQGPRHPELQGAPRAQRAVPWCQKAAASPRSVPPSKGRPGTLQPTPHISHPACNGTKTPPRTKTPPTKRALRYLGQEIPAAPGRPRCVAGGAQTPAQTNAPLAHRELPPPRPRSHRVPPGPERIQPCAARQLGLTRLLGILLIKMTSSGLLGFPWTAIRHAQLCFFFFIRGVSTLSIQSNW